MYFGLFHFWPQKQNFRIEIMLRGPEKKNTCPSSCTDTSGVTEAQPHTGREGNAVGMACSPAAAGQRENTLNRFGAGSQQRRYEGAGSAAAEERTPGLTECYDFLPHVTHTGYEHAQLVEA